MGSSNVTVVDYGFGNVQSVVNALKSVGATPIITSSPEDLSNAQDILLPGVGAYSSAMESLSSHGLDDAIRGAVKQGSRLVGVCLGMQLLFDRSEEFGVTEGLGLLRGSVQPLVSKSEVTPSMRSTHIGWSKVRPQNEGRLSNWFRSTDSEFYFVHSFAGQTSEDQIDSVAATASYRQREFIAAVELENVFGLQFHPERSGKPGLSLLAHFFSPG